MAVAHATMTAVQLAVSGRGVGTVSWAALLALNVPIPAAFAVALRHRLSSMDRQRATIDRVFRTAAARGRIDVRLSSSAFLVPVDEVVCMGLRYGYQRVATQASATAHARYLHFARPADAGLGHYGTADRETAG